MLLEDARRGVVDMCREVSVRGLVVGTAGNVSVRDGDLIAVSPSGVRYRELQPEQVSVVALDGDLIESPLRPTTELALHLVVHNRPAGADGEVVLHTHAPASTALSVLVDEVPVVHYYAALFGGAIRVTRYARFGSVELADSVRDALVDRTAAVMGNHGAVLVAADPAAALDRAEYLEYLCEVALRVLSTGLPPRLLDAAELDRVGVALRDYGQPPVEQRV